MARRIDILPSKITPPRVGVPLLPRPRLLPFVRDVLNKKMLILSAEAGYGKTSVLLSLLPDLDAPVAWLTLDDSDADPNLFSAGLVSAVRMVAPHFGEEVLKVLTSGPRAAVLRDHLIRALGTLATTVVVLDDFQALDDAPDTRGLVDQVLLALPPQVHVIAATRTWPALASLPTLLVAGHAAVLDRGRLGFDADEAAMFFLQGHAITLTPDQARAVTMRTEGWPAALQLVALASKQRGTIPLEGTPREIFDYLATAVVDRLEPAIREFLVRTSILTEFWPSLCRAVSEEADPGGILDEIERRNLFVYRLDDVGPRLRYHQLFAEFLQQHLASRGREVVADLHRRAGRQLEEEGLPERAVRHYIAAEAYDEAERVMKPIHGDRLTAREAYVFRDIVSRLPEEIQTKYPWMTRSGASSCRFVGDYHRGLVFAQRAMAAAEDRDPTLWAFAVHGIGVMYSHLDRFEDTVALCRRALARVDDARVEPRMKAGILAVLLDCLIQLGDLAAAEDVLPVLEAMSAQGTHPGRSYGATYFAGVIACIRFAYGQAVDHLRHALDTARQRGSLTFQAWAASELAAAELALHSPGAFETLQLAKNLHAQTGERANDLRLGYLAGEAHLLRGDVASAEESFHHTFTRSREEESEEPKVWSLLGLARAARVRQNLAEAESLLQAAITISRRIKLGKVAPRLGLERAALLHDAGRPREALDALVPARLTLAQWDAPVGAAWCALLQARLEWTVAATERPPETTAQMLSSAIETVAACASDLLPSLRFERRWTVPLLLQALRGGIAVQAAEVLLRGLGATAVDSLIDALGEPPLRASAIRLLGQIGDPRARRPLTRLHGSRADEMRTEVERAIASLRTPEPAALRVKMLGAFDVVRDGIRVDDRSWKTQKVKFLLKYLLLHRDQAVQQEQLIDVLWPEADPAAGAVNLKTAVKHLRLALEPLLEGSKSHYVRRDGERLRFTPAPSCWVDLDEYNRLASDARRFEAAGDVDGALSAYQQVAALYSGDLLEDDRYEDWVIIERERLRERHLELLSALAGLHARRKDFRSAVETIQAILALDRLRESAYRDLIRYSLQRGDQIAAVRAYRTCERVLREELGVSPQPETLAILEHAGLLA